MPFLVSKDTETVEVKVETTPSDAKVTYYPGNGCFR